MEVHRLAVSSDSGVEGAAAPDEPDMFPKAVPEPKAFVVLSEPGGSVSGRLGM